MMNLPAALLGRYSCPQFTWSLSDIDTHRYCRLKTLLLANSTKVGRNRRESSFAEMLESIRGFALQGDKDDNRRCMACGVCWLPEGLGINTHVLRLLIPKCKSSINGSLHRLGYAGNLTRSEAAHAICDFFPSLKDNAQELRKWTVRKGQTSLTAPVINSCSNVRAVGNSLGKFEVPLEGITKSTSTRIVFADEAIGTEQSAPPAWSDFPLEPRWQADSPRDQASSLSPHDDMCIALP
jgi:hypothetical protein